MKTPQIPALPGMTPLGKPAGWTRETAIARFRVLIARYGIQWQADVPREAWDELASINQFLTEKDRREAFTGAWGRP
jgi:hypothetical protein